MRIYDLYGWGLPKATEYFGRYRDNEQLYNMARSLWAGLDSAAIYFIAFFIVTGVLIACFYYFGYNRLPGRKYKIRHWLVWFFLTAVVTSILTFFVGKIIVSSNLQEKVGFLVRISMINGAYSLVTYFLTSFIVCNTPVPPTNAYRFLKIGK